MLESSPSLVAAQQRLDRLEGFLRQDPSNNALLIDAFETALACHAWDRAEFHLRHALALKGGALEWRLREGDFFLAQHRDGDAVRVLEALAATPDPPPGLGDAVQHNLAFIDFRAGRFAACADRLAPLLEAEPLGPTRTGTAASDPVGRLSLQMLWLRALHQCGQLERAMDWARRRDAARRLNAHVAGVASLIALDASDFDMAVRWAEASLALTGEPGPPAETLITKASLALAAQDSVQALRFAQAALALRPADGRVWSAHAFATLLAGDLPGARKSFDRSLQAMPAHIGTWHGLGWTQILQGDFAAARVTFEKALVLDRNLAESHGGLAVALAMANQKADAIASADRALGLDKSNLSGRYAQALLSGEVKNGQDIQRLAQRLVRGRLAPFGGDMADLFAHERPGQDGGSGS